MTSTERPQGTAPRELGPQRFQRAGPSGPNDRPERHMSRAIGAGLALLVLVVGVPIGLYLLGGLPPVPTSWPTRQDLVGAIGPELVLGVLLWVVWLAWLQFTLCVLVEMRSAVRGIGLPGRVPLAGGSQRFARVLVGSVLLVATSVGQANAAAAPTTGSPDVAVTAAEMASETAQVQEEQAERAEERAAADEGEASSAASSEATYKLGDMTLDAEEAEGLVGKKVYVVQPPEGRYHDNMWDIAERTLGDGRRYPEIFNLNEGREQPDGRELSLSRLIQPNWLLVVPDDAEGVDRVREIHAGPATSPGTSAGGGPGDGAQAEHSKGSTQPAGEREHGQQPAQQPPDRADLPAAGAAGGATGADDASDPGVLGGLGNLAEDLLGAGLLAAGLLGAVDAVRRRRRTLEPGPEEIDAEVALRIGADPDRVILLDTALRALATAQSEQPGTGATLPAAYAAVVGDDYVELRISPPRTDAPAPWRIQQEGRSWVVRREDLTGTRADGPAPYPGLVSLGRDDTDRDVLIDLEAAGGPVSVVGEPSVATEVVTALAAELATNAWSDRLSVTGYGLPDELSVLRRLQTAQSIDAVLPELHRRVQAGDEQDVLVGRLRGGPAAWTPEFLMLGAQPEPDELERLSALTAGGARTALGVVVAGQVPGARWTVHVNAVGDLEIPLLGLSVQANRLPGEHVPPIAALVDPLEPERVEPGEVASQFLERPDVPRPAATATPAGAATAAVLVSVLGGASVRAPGSMDAERLALSTEIVVYLALHREGVHPTVLAGAVWPGGVTTNVREASIERVRDWLGTDSSGVPQLQQGTDGHLWLGPEVVVDLDVVTGLLEQSRQAATADAERDALRAALRTARGPMLADRPRGRYAWMARVRLERATADVLVDAAHRLSVLCEHQPDPDGAADAARAGLRIRPGDQVLWRDLIRATGGGPDDPDTLATTVAEMTRTLAELGQPRLEPETLALLEELAPGLVVEEPHPA